MNITVYKWFFAFLLMFFFCLLSCSNEKNNDQKLAVVDYDLLISKIMDLDQGVFKDTLEFFSSHTLENLSLLLENTEHKFNCEPYWKSVIKNPNKTESILCVSNDDTVEVSVVIEAGTNKIDFDGDNLYKFYGKNECFVNDYFFTYDISLYSKKLNITKLAGHYWSPEYIKGRFLFRHSLDLDSAFIYLNGVYESGYNGCGDNLSHNLEELLRIQNKDSIILSYFQNKWEEYGNVNALVKMISLIGSQLQNQKLNSNHIEIQFKSDNFENVTTERYWKLVKQAADKNLNYYKFKYAKAILEGTVEGETEETAMDYLNSSCLDNYNLSCLELSFNNAKNDYLSAKEEIERQLDVVTGSAEISDCYYFLYLIQEFNQKTDKDLQVFYLRQACQLGHASAFTTLSEMGSSCKEQL